MWAMILMRLPWLSRLGGFLTSGKFLAFLAAIIIALFIISQSVSFVDKVVDTRVEATLSKAEAENLKNQIKVLKRNQVIVNEVVKETKVVQAKQEEKAAKIEEKIDEQVKNGEDGYGGAIIESVIDSL